MPIFMDTHPETTDMPEALRERVASRVRSGERDEFQVVDRGIIIDQEGRNLHCLLEAPDVGAVMQHHRALGVPVGEETIHRADVILP